MAKVDVVVQVGLTLPHGGILALAHSYDKRLASAVAKNILGNKARMILDDHGQIREGVEEDIALYERVFDGIGLGIDEWNRL